MAVQVKQVAGWIALAAGVGVAVWLIIRFTKKNKQEQAGNEQVLDVVDTIVADSDASKKITESATINQLQAKALATKIKNAWGILNDDESAVYGAFADINNLADLMLVMQAYGVWKDEDLVTAIQSRMNSGEVDKINQILENKKINYKF